MLFWSQPDDLGVYVRLADGHTRADIGSGVFEKFGVSWFLLLCITIFYYFFNYIQT